MNLRKIIGLTALLPLSLSLLLIGE